MILNVQPDYWETFCTNKDNYPCAWIESKKIQGFCLILNQEGLSWLRTYLETGEAEDFGFNPNSVTAYGEGNRVGLYADK